ncbi:ketopantoate reductase PanE/ApbA C terminal-domain-containing protein [Aspergillus carlsbadensis]|nr:ketopantoate reductase PanE/ApbA C terminal-domain-containing protein [Aspergillus carlsbadensis]
MFNICLIGAGGVGTIAAYVLESSQRARVTAVLRSNYTAVHEHGFDIDSVDHGHVTGWKPHRVVPSLSAAARTDTPYDFIVITTKALPSTTASLLTLLPGLITPQKTSIVLIQNGLDIEEPFAAAFPTTPVMSSSSMIGSHRTSPNAVVHEDPDVSRIEPYIHHTDPDPNTQALCSETQRAAAQTFVTLYSAGLAAAHPTTGAECILTHGLGARWRKLLWNGTFNPLCTLLRVSVGALLRGPGRTTLLEPAMREMAAIATAAGYGDAVSEEVVVEVLGGTPETSGFRPSMLVDLEGGRVLEIEAILGAPLRVAREKNVPTPVLRWVYEALRVVQWGLERQVYK